MQFKKKLLSLLLVFSMVLSFVPTAFAAETEDENNAPEQIETNLPESGEETPAPSEETPAPVEEYTFQELTPAESEAMKAESLIMPLSLDMDSAEPYSINTPYGISNTFVEVAVGSNGQFTMGTLAGDPDDSGKDDNKLLLYGHGSSPWSSETLIRIDGVDHIFDKCNPTVSVNGNTCTATATISGVTVQQILTLMTNPFTNREDVVAIKYQYTNNSGSAKQVGVRIMLDTMLGDNDGAPFRVNGEDVETEVEFTGNDVPQYWQAFDNLDDPSVVSTGFFYFNSAEKPDKVQFAHWAQIHGHSWDYQVTDGHPVTGDSAVAAYFTRNVGAGGTNSVVTYYGISGFAESNTDTTPPLVVRVTNPIRLTADASGAGYTNNPFNVTAYLDNTGSSSLTNVSAELVPDGNAFYTDTGDDADYVKTVGTMAAGDKQTLQWNLLAKPQDTQYKANYNIVVNYTDGGVAKSKTITLKLVLEALSAAARTRTVTFDLNGKPGTAPAPQTVDVGNFVPKPTDPEVSGYTFDGWYANRNCTGIKWFDVNGGLGQRVTNNITLYAKWVEDGFIYGRDTFQFINSYADFFANAPYNYKITGEYRDTLLNGRPNNVRQSLINAMGREWGGSCFGMSSVLSLVRAGELDEDFFQASASCLHDFEYPRNSRTVFNLVNYYHLMQYTPETRAFLYSSANTISSVNQKIINNLPSDNKDATDPVLVAFYILDGTGNVTGGHAVVAYGYSDNGSEYLVRIWDPNDKNTPNVLHISKDFSNSYFQNVYTRSKVIAALTVDEGSYDYRNIQGALTPAATSASVNDTSMYTLNTNYDSFSITDGTNSATIVNGVKTSGTLNIGDAQYAIDAIGENQMVQFALPVLSGGASYTVTPNASGKTETSLSYSATANGFYANVAAAAAGELRFADDGEVETTFGSATSQTVTVALNSIDPDRFPWYAVETTGSTTGVTVTPTANATTASVAINSKDDGALTVTASNDHNQVGFQGQPSPITLTSTKANNDVVMTNGDSKTETKTMDHFVIFYSMGGSAVADNGMKTVSHGQVVAKPTDPVRPRFDFNGWVDEHGNPWNFTTPITRDTRLFATWTEASADAIVTITFNFGTYTQPLIVYKGTVITASMIPDPTPGMVWGFPIVGWVANGNKEVGLTSNTGSVTPPPTSVNPNSYVFIPNVAGGTVVPSELNPSWGSQVILYAHPKEGYELTSLTVTDVRGWAVTTREISAGSYVFTMPDVRVTVNAVFSPIDSEEAPDTTVSVPAAGIGYGSYADIVYPMAPMAYSDVNTSDWFYSSVEYVYKRRMMSGKTDSAFDPSSPAERHVTWTALARMSGRDTTGGATEYERGQIWAMNKGITDGSNPTGSLTREQLMTMLWRFKGSPVTPNDTLTGFADNAKVSTWARDAVNWAVANGLLNGSYGNLNPQGETTRAETAAILMRFHQNIR